MPTPTQPIFPALYLYPLNESFIPKHILLPQAQRIKIGRQTNAKTAPGERNGFFDSKVLSRQHAEVWEEANRIYIKDVKSSNGTFINGERLSPEGLESDPFELKNDDIVEFGIDIVAEDNKSIIHHKVAARVFCVFNEQDAQVAYRAEQHQHQQFQAATPGGASSLLTQPLTNSSTINGTSSFNFAPTQQRRPQVASRGGLMDMGGMGGSMRPPGKSGLTFEHILSRLQGEIQKSRETGAELHTLSGAMNEIHDNLGGNLPGNVPSYTSALPPVGTTSLRTQPQTQLSCEHVLNQGSSSHSPEEPSYLPSTLAASALADLQAQLRETRSSLTTHIDKIRVLEDALSEQESIKQEVRALRAMMKEREAEFHRHLRQQRLLATFDDEDEKSAIHHHEDDEDDAQSVATIIPHELERVDEDEEEQLAAHVVDKVPEIDCDGFGSLGGDLLRSNAGRLLEPPDNLEDEDVLRRNDEFERPRTPEPTNLGMRGDGESFNSLHHAYVNLDCSSNLHVSPRRQIPAQNLVTKKSILSPGFTTEDVLEQVLNQVSALLTLTSSLEAQHMAAQSMISTLESKVQALEANLLAERAGQVNAETQTSVPSSPLATALHPCVDNKEEQESLSAMVLEWKRVMEGQWTTVREDWDKERERLIRAREQWQQQSQKINTGLEKLSSLQGATASSLRQQQQREQDYERLFDQQQHRVELLNGNAIKHIGLVTPPSPRSLSSDSNRPRRRRVGGTSRGRSRHRTRSESGEQEAEFDSDTDITLASEDASPSRIKVVRHPFHRPYPPAASKVIDIEKEEDTVLGIRAKFDATTTAIPESTSMVKLSLPNITDTVRKKSTTEPRYFVAFHGEKVAHLQTTIGVLVLAVAAAAVIWRVKPET